MFGFCPLASGSKGNAIFVGTNTTRILIDAGLSYTNLIKRLEEIHVAPETIQAICITHEHIDHIQGLRLITKRLKIPILANAETAKGIYATLGIRPQFKIFTTGESFLFGDLEVHPFSVPHDTLDPVAFVIHTSNQKLGFCTDLGYVTSLVKKQLELCDYLYLEANHQPSMVHASSRPPLLKQRILGKQGHLSNEQCANLLVSLWHSGLKHVHLAHLSGECNTEEVALQVVQETLAAHKLSVPLTIAYQDRISKAMSLSCLSCS